MITEHQQMPTIEIKAVDTPKLPEKAKRPRLLKRGWESHPLSGLFQRTSGHYHGKTTSTSAAQKRIRRNKAAKAARKANRFG